LATFPIATGLLVVVVTFFCWLLLEIRVEILHKTSTTELLSSINSFTISIPFNLLSIPVQIDDGLVVAVVLGVDAIAAAVVGRHSTILGDWTRALLGQDLELGWSLRREGLFAS
jgi:hypothetical protein